MDILNLKTQIYFGKDVVKHLGQALKENKVKKIMLVYGGGSIFKNGIYDAVTNELKTHGISFVEYKGVKPNPEEEHTYLGAKFASKNKVNAILAVGGGSVVDAAKVMAALATNPNYKDCWSYVLNPSKATNKALSVYAIPTLAGTASENNDGSVISNPKTKQKYGVFNTSARPVAAFLDPTYTYTVNPWQTASGIFDCFSHLLEQFYDSNSFEWTKQYIFANLRTLLKYALIAVKAPKNYDARANVLFTTTMALNGLADFESDSDWKVHKIEHGISGIWDVTHGAGLALVTPTYIKYRCNHDNAFLKQTLELANEVFGVKTLNAFLLKLRNFIKGLGLPLKFSDFKEISKLSPKEREQIYEHAAPFIKKKDLTTVRDVINLIPF